MATSVTLPALGESVTEGTVTRWLKQPGDTVEVDEPLLEVSTDKVDTEIPSPVAGTLLEIKANEDDTVEVGAVLAMVGDESEAGGSGDASDGGEQQAQEQEPEQPEQSEQPAEGGQEEAGGGQDVEQEQAEQQAAEQESGGEPPSQQEPAAESGGGDLLVARGHRVAVHAGDARGREVDGELGLDRLRADAVELHGREGAVGAGGRRALLVPAEVAEGDAVRTVVGEPDVAGTAPDDEPAARAELAHHRHCLQSIRSAHRQSTPRGRQARALCASR